MNSKGNQRIIFLIVAGVLLTVLIASICFVSSRLPSQLSLPDFVEGIVEVDLKKHPFAEIAPTIYFYKDGNIDELINYLSSNGIVFDEQFGDSYIFVNGDNKTNASAMAITRWHNILILNN